MNRTGNEDALLRSLIGQIAGKQGRLGVTYREIDLYKSRGNHEQAVRARERAVRLEQEMMQLRDKAAKRRAELGIEVTK